MTRRPYPAVARRPGVKKTPKSYVSGADSPLLSIIQNARQLTIPPQEIENCVGLVNLATAHLKRCYGVAWRNCRLLDVGCGQLLCHAPIFGMTNTVTGIDTELALKPPYVPDLVRCVVRSGMFRAVKTCSRQLIGVDRRFRRMLALRLGIEELPHVSTRCMDAKRLGFADSTFDGVYSFSAFQHIDDPAVAAREIHRIMKRGGVAYVRLHLYTSTSGSDHPLVFSAPDDYPPWGHLRASTRFHGREGVYHNRWRLAQWRKLFQEVFGVVHYPLIDGEIERNRRLLTPSTRAELADYDEEELLITTLTAVCRKA